MQITKIFMHSHVYCGIFYNRQLIVEWLEELVIEGSNQVGRKTDQGAGKDSEKVALQNNPDGRKYKELGPEA